MRREVAESTRGKIGVDNGCEHDAGPGPWQALPTNPPYCTEFAVWCVKCNTWQPIDNGPTVHPKNSAQEKP